MASTVLVGVLKHPEDIHILLERKWYRIPAEKCPKRKAAYLAFYQPGNPGYVRYYARPTSWEAVKREWLVRGAPPEKIYYKVAFDRIRKLKRPLKNTSGMRVSFAFTTLTRLKRAKNLAGALGVIPVEKRMGNALKKARIPVIPEYMVRAGGKKRYRLDFAYIRDGRKIDIECDSEKWHGQKSNKNKDKRRDLALKKAGWSILRLKEREIAGNIGHCLLKVKQKIRK